jgi:hypothetical protein
LAVELQQSQPPPLFLPLPRLWYSLNLVLVLFAIACAFLNRNHNSEDQSVPNASQEADPEREEAGRRRSRLTQKEKRVPIFKNPSTVPIFKNPTTIQSKP